ncbi:MAG: hypothetical protein HOH43_12610 [Candidatus Latescibacteria bacterium]|nr:hypothetical protein [Candidatus Latescibacterota bacterium]
MADFNEDGRLDLAISNHIERPTMYFNNLTTTGNWSGIKLVGTESNRDAIGAHIRLTAGGKTMTRQIKAGAGYASQAMLAAHFGLGSAEFVEAIDITWPGGKKQHFDKDALIGTVNQMITIEEGADKLVAQR